MDATLYSEIARLERGDYLLFHCEPLSQHHSDISRYFFGAYYPRWQSFYLEEVRSIIGNLGYNELKHFPAFAFDTYRKPNGETYTTDDFQLGSVLVVSPPQNLRDDDTKRFKVVTVDYSHLRTATGRLPPIRSSSAANPGTMVLAQTGIRVPVQISTQVQQILFELREAYVAHLGYGIPELGVKAMGRPFRAYSADGKRYISFPGMMQLIRDSRAFGISPKYESVQATNAVVKEMAMLLYASFPKETNGQIDYDMFMDFVRGHMNELRKKEVQKVFQALDYDKDGHLCIKDIQACFNAHEHPVVVHDGLFRADALCRGFLTWWDEGNTMYGTIPYSEWLDYYNGLNAVIAEDRVFLGVLQNTWKLGPWTVKHFPH